MAACGDDAATVTTQDQPMATGLTTAPTADTSDASTTPAESLLTNALDNVGARYAFTATVTLDGVETTGIVGTVYDGTGAYVVTSVSATVDYVVGPDGQWARQEGGVWTPLAAAAPLVDQLTPLAHPLRVDVIESDGDNALLVTAYTGTDLGFAADGEVTVTIVITGGAVTAISYEAPVGNGTATVTTTFDPTADVAPIQVPPA
jgi:hypothetical protein